MFLAMTTGDGICIQRTGISWYNKGHATGKSSCLLFWLAIIRNWMMDPPWSDVEGILLGFCS